MQKIAIIGLGYVGLPLAIAFAKQHKNVVGYDINLTRIEELKCFKDYTLEVSQNDFKAAKNTTFF